MSWLFGLGEEPTADQIEAVRVIAADNAKRFAAISASPRASEFWAAILIMRARVDNDTALATQRYDTSKTLEILSRVKATAEDLKALEAKLSVPTPPPPVLPHVVVRDEPVTPVKKPTQKVDWTRHAVPQKPGAKWYMDWRVYAAVAGAGALIYLAKKRK